MLSGCPYVVVPAPPIVMRVNDSGPDDGSEQKNHGGGFSLQGKFG
jgi:hypothetical protein